MMCGDVHCTPGSHIELPLGAAFGPFVAGPNGTRLYEVMMGDPRSWSDDEDSMVALLAARGAERLLDPPIDLPGGLEDLRQVYARAEALAVVVAARWGVRDVAAVAVGVAGERGAVVLVRHRADHRGEGDCNSLLSSSRQSRCNPHVSNGCSSARGRATVFRAWPWSGM